MPFSVYLNGIGSRAYFFYELAAQAYQPRLPRWSSDVKSKLAKLPP